MAKKIEAQIEHAKIYLSDNLNHSWEIVIAPKISKITFLRGFFSFFKNNQTIVKRSLNNFKRAPLIVRHFFAAAISVELKFFLPPENSIVVQTTTMFWWYGQSGKNLPVLHNPVTNWG